MDTNLFACTSPLCDGARWAVERVDGPEGLWRVASGPADAGFLVAAPEPICPRCAERLRPATELKGAPRHVRHAA